MSYKRISCGLLALLLLCSLFTFCACSRGTTPGLRVAVLDVGQSDAILVSQGEHHLLIDAGTVTERDHLLGALCALGVDTLDYLLLTHPHEDHVGNARTVIERFVPDALLTSAASSEEIAYLTALEFAKKQNCPHNVLENGNIFMLGDAKCEVLFAGDGEGENNDSIVLRVVYDACVFLFTGDAEAALEQKLLAQYTQEKLDCDFLKVGHHGSDTSSTAEFLNVITPTIAAISCGEDNSYGFPHGEVLTALEEIGAAVYRTDLDGTLIFACDGEKIEYQNERDSIWKRGGR